ncbi:histone-fold domain-containing protein [Aspergillus glaucus CBS 516.65]|uniref:Transcription factor CBF/NF-Y/archaeal histone domain-containing protein n=1 Tax=Aspergillus glaucus CBS 516.65 TaxID=1160497 RepID=A0A1L9VCZ8_ASPGL|nr:hypothetical protein ASPGLDRAFT_50276 [Aspergillus glaucus CBS 516.65]OJJ81722.1 hypothetical protein ASPGLDRAFT_50276 [Aspergillus glaucus CBS 516.65]
MSSKDAPEPSDEITGQSALPISRIKKIIQLDDDIVQCSTNATFVISVATEMFIQYLAEQGHNVVKSERKPRKTIQYKDLATAVSRIDNLEFLSDVIPKTTTYKQFKEKKAKEGPVKSGGIEKGQRTLNGTKSSKSKSLKPKVNGDSIDQDRPSTEEPLRSSGAPITLVVDRTVEGGSKEQDRDVEMTDQ